MAHHDCQDINAAAALTALPFADSELATPVFHDGEPENGTCAPPTEATTSPTDLGSSTALDLIGHFDPSEASNEDARDYQPEADVTPPSSLDPNSRPVSQQCSPGLSPKSVSSSFLDPDRIRTAYSTTPTSLTSPFSPTPRGVPFGRMRGPAGDQAREARLKILEARVVALAAQLDVVRLELAELLQAEAPLIDI